MKVENASKRLISSKYEENNVSRIWNFYKSKNKKGFIFIIIKKKFIFGKPKFFYYLINLFLEKQIFY